MRVIDLFAGCGGLSLGFQNAGFNVVAGFDNWDPAIKVYQANLQHPIVRQDLSDVPTSVEAIRAFQPQLIMGGPPCQDFSHAGKRSEGRRANLTIAFAKIVTSPQLRPEWFLMENVDRALTSGVFKDAQDIFRATGYGLTVSVLDAARCGIPQHRKRLVCIGKMGELDDFLSDHIAVHLASKPMTVRDYFGADLDFEYYYRHPRNYSRRAVYSIDEPAATIRGVNRPIPSGYKKHPGDPVNPKRVRPLTTEERSRIQTFPAEYKWLGSKTDREQMIGNAVPVKLGQFVAECIAEFSKGSI